VRLLVEVISPPFLRYNNMNRSIIHLNIADFAVAVETSIQPSLKGCPVVIAPLGVTRSLVYDMSDKAYQDGIRKKMPLSRAKQINKKIKILAPNFNRYELVMKNLLKEALAYTPLIESGMSDGHIFLDVTGSKRLLGPPADIAFKLKKVFNKKFNLDPVWSVAANKMVAKVATRVVKPAGEYIVSQGDEKAFLAPLPIHLIPGLMKTDLTQLKEFNLFYVFQARALSLEHLRVLFPNRAALIYERFRGIDPSFVTGVRENKSTILADHEFADDTNNEILLKKALYLMVEKICLALRNRNLHVAATKIILSYSDGLQSISKLKLIASTSNDMTMFKKAVHLLYKAWTRRIRIRHMRLICEKLSPLQIQTEFFTHNTKERKQMDLISTIDKIRTKFGKNAIKTGLTI